MIPPLFLEKTKVRKQSHIKCARDEEGDRIECKNFILIYYLQWNK